MSRNESITAADLAGKLEWLHVVCNTCGWRGRYRVSKIPPDMLLTEWLAEATSDCPRRIADRYNDWCGAHCPDVARILF